MKFKISVAKSSQFIKMLWLKFDKVWHYLFLGRVDILMLLIPIQSAI